MQFCNKDQPPAVVPPKRTASHRPSLPQNNFKNFDWSHTVTCHTAATYCTLCEIRHIIKNIPYFLVTELTYITATGLQTLLYRRLYADAL